MAVSCSGLTFSGLAVLALSAGGVNGKISFGKFAKSLSYDRSKSSGGDYSSSTKHVSASVKCSSDAYAESNGDQTNDYIKAVTNLVRDVCDPAWNGDLQTLRDDMSGWAGAWARATAKVSSSCVSKTSGGGKAQGCAYSEAAAAAYEVAYASAHASASAEAFAKYCSCNDAAAWAFGEASFFLTLIADVFAEATSAACASGNESSEASAYSSCYARVAADTYAKAVASVSISAECGYYQNSRVSADVLAEVDGTIYIDEYCSFESERDGLTDASSSGNTYTRADRH